MITKNQLKLALLSAWIVTSYVTFTLVAFNAGFDNQFIFRWLISWTIAFVIVVPSLLFVGPAIKKTFKLQD